jgi:hypothetical protein
MTCKVACAGAEANPNTPAAATPRNDKRTDAAATSDEHVRRDARWMSGYGTLSLGLAVLKEKPGRICCPATLTAGSRRTTSRPNVRAKCTIAVFTITVHALDGRDNAGTGDWIGQWVRFAKMRRVQLEGHLAEARVQDYDPIIAFVHLVSPGLDFLDFG